MKYAVVKRAGNGNHIESIEFRELTRTQAENLSEIAAVVSLATNAGGTSTIYRNRRAEQAFVNYDELLETARRAAQRSERNGWIS